MNFLRLAAIIWWTLLICVLPAAAGDFRLLVLENAFVKWGKPVLGSAAAVTYAFATRETTEDGARNCRHMMPFADLSAAARLPLAALKIEARRAFQTWEHFSALRFREVADPKAADILIGIQADPAGLAFTNVDPVKPGTNLNEPGLARVNTIRRSLICLNPQQVWKIGFDGNSKTYDVRYALTHEIGHAIGLDHPGPSGALMGFRYSEEIPGLQSGDIEAVRTLYGQ